MPRFNSLYPAAQLTLELLRGRMVSQLMGGLSGSPDSFGDVILPDFSAVMRRPVKPMRSGAEMMNDALGGLRRGEAVMYRQASRNMAEGSSMVEMAAEGVKNIQNDLQRMQDIVAAIQQDSSLASALTPEYNDLAKSVAALVQGTEYNGIRLLDGSGWDHDKRIAVGPGKATGKISLQAGESATDLTLFNLEDLTKLYPAPNLADPATASATAGMLSASLGRLSVIREIYEARSRLYASEASSFVRQADILDHSAKRPGFDGGKNSGDILFEMIMGGRGGIVNARG
ncbi:MAG: hypothetical protein LBR94_08755 [Desulfovibrio sp.]|nr:hypothetical protein [Desulfovibrio sp.]